MDTGVGRVQLLAPMFQVTHKSSRLDPWLPLSPAAAPLSFWLVSQSQTLYSTAAQTFDGTFRITSIVVTIWLPFFNKCGSPLLYCGFLARTVDVDRIHVEISH